MLGDFWFGDIERAFLRLGDSYLFASSEARFMPLLGYGPTERLGIDLPNFEYLQFPIRSHRKTTCFVLRTYAPDLTVVKD